MTDRTKEVTAGFSHLIAPSMTTPELLEKASASDQPPLTKHKCQCGDPVCNSWFISWTRSGGRLEEEQAELIVRAVSSFAAMREALRAYIDSCSDSPHTIDDARAMAEKALALADGGQL